MLRPSTSQESSLQILPCSSWPAIGSGEFENDGCDDGDGDGDDDDDDGGDDDDDDDDDDGRGGCGDC